jgi:hypothetical protein
MKKAFKFITQLLLVGSFFALGYAASVVVWEPEQSYGDDTTEDSDVDAASAQEETAPVVTPTPKATKEEEKDTSPPPALGVIAATLPPTGYGSHGLASATDADLTGSVSPTIGGSLSRTGNLWSFTVQNNSKTKYSITLELTQLGAKGREVKRDSASYSLAPGEKASRSFPSSPSSLGASLKLVSARKVPAKRY